MCIRDSFLIAPTPLLDYIKSLPVQPLTLEMQTTEEGARFIHLIHSTGYLDIPIGDAELYVSRESPEDSEGAAMMSMNSSSLLSGISAVLPAAYPCLLYTSQYPSDAPQNGP